MLQKVKKKDVLLQKLNISHEEDDTSIMTKYHWWKGAISPD